MARGGDYNPVLWYHQGVNDLVTHEAKAMLFIWFAKNNAGHGC